MSDKFYPKSLDDAKDYVKRAEIFLHSMTIDNVHDSALCIHSIASQINHWSTCEKRVIEGRFIDDLSLLIDILDQISLIVAKSINKIYDFRRILDSQTDIPFEKQLDYLFVDQSNIICTTRIYRYVLTKLQEEQNEQTQTEEKK